MLSCPSSTAPVLSREPSHAPEIIFPKRRIRNLGYSSRDYSINTAVERNGDASPETRVARSLVGSEEVVTPGICKSTVLFRQPARVPSDQWLKALKAKNRMHAAQCPCFAPANDQLPLNTKK